MLPTFTHDGLLPAGIYPASWAEFTARFGFSARRAALLGLVIAALRHLAAAGCATVYVGGSFVTSKKSPKDLDILIVTDGVDVSLVHPMFVDLHVGRSMTLAMFGAEFFPVWLVEDASGLTFLEFFQHTRAGAPKGIVLLDLTTLPPA